MQHHRNIKTRTISTFLKKNREKNPVEKKVVTLDHQMEKIYDQKLDNDFV